MDVKFTERGQLELFERAKAHFETLDTTTSSNPMIRQISGIAEP